MVCVTFWTYQDDSNDNAKIKKIIFRILQLLVIMHHDAIWHHFEIDDIYETVSHVSKHFFYIPFEVESGH